MDPLDLGVIVAKALTALLVVWLVFAAIKAANISKIYKKTGDTRQSLAGGALCGVLVLAILLYPYQVCGGLIVLIILAVIVIQVRKPGEMEYPKS